MVPLYTMGGKTYDATTNLPLAAAAAAAPPPQPTSWFAAATGALKTIKCTFVDCNRGNGKRRADDGDDNGDHDPADRDPIADETLEEECKLTPPPGHVAGRQCQPVPCDRTFCFASGKGKRSKNEDAHVACSEKNGVEVYGVFDGHGGDRASKHLSEHLADFLLRDLPSAGASDDDLKRYVATKFVQFDEEQFSGKGPSRSKDPQNGGDSGSTAVVAVKIPQSGGSSERLVVAVLGDARATMRVGKERLHETKDQKPGDEAEKQRIIGTGIANVMFYGCSRVVTEANNGQRATMLGTSGAFGDYKDQLKRVPESGNLWEFSPIRIDDETEQLPTMQVAGKQFANTPVRNVPDVYVWEIPSGEKATLVLGCDGVWDVMSSEEAVSHVEALGSAEKACRSLYRKAYHHGDQHDNITVMVKIFNDKSKRARQ